ncbi:hypothetical protein JOB18_004430 [Solea senegalensis]|uniref:Uncharacterized protein n=1 Tax=Solea senegalensis TaxID=28829 RepID=A0AAV6SJT5_SOLSE|nr:hypothetical protein JOB18_004430 [Solea senegalensis]
MVSELRRQQRSQRRGIAATPRLQELGGERGGGGGGGGGGPAVIRSEDVSHGPEEECQRRR